ncbi:sulfite exporter TauE/SafE family protein [Jannaschia sp. 2305UL9-9]|uniref:sulfite exporter TauE/SafE family protein n=1 Tax=Jannaschia sp. 2305UL9-9 TaxID=3121638 RepID=UPI0035290FF6
MGALSLTDPWALLAVAVALSLGGILKGATGAGLPVISVPVLASLYDVRVAVAVMVLPNLVTNLNQVRKFRAHAVHPAFVRRLAISGALGAGVGTLALAWLPVAVVEAVMVCLIVAFIALRLTRPDLRLSQAIADRWVWLAGGTGGILQGAVGISAPVAVTFLSSMALPRPQFIVTVSAFFAATCVIQLPVQIHYGIMTVDTALLGLFALIPLTAAVPVGEWIGQRFSAAMFDRVILLFLGALAVKLLLDLV